MPTYEELMGGTAVAPAAKSAVAKTSFSYEELAGQASPTAKPAAPPLEEPAFEREARAQKSASFFDNVGTHLAAGAADVVDFLVTGIFGMPVAAASDAAIRATPGTVKAVPAVGVINALQYAGQRIGGKLAGNEAGGKEILEASLGGTRAQIGARAQASTETTMKALGQPARDLLRITGLLPEGYESAADKGFAYVMGKAKEAGAAVEQSTGGAITQDDVMSAVTYTFGLMGAKGLDVAAKGIATTMDAAKAKRVFKELEAAQVERQAAEEANAEAQRSATATASETPAAPYASDKTQADADLAAADARVNAEKQAYDLMRRGASLKEVEAAVKRNPALGAAMAEVRHARKTLREFLEVPDLPPIREDGSFREGALGAILRRPSEMSAAEMAARDAAAGIKRGPLGEPIQLTPEQQFRTRGRKAGGAADQELLTAMVVGATGLGLAMAFKPDAEEAALAVGAGALILGRGKVGDLTLEAVRNAPDATPLKAFVERDTTTLRTIETLVRQSPGRFEFNIDSIRQLLKQPEITKAERDIFDRILVAVPEGATTITAKELMEGKKIATGDFELRKQDLSGEAPGRINSSTADTLTKWGLESIRERYTPATESQRLDGVEMNSLNEVLSEPIKTAQTHIWQSPIELGSNNHFGDPNYFGHTRVFEEGGIRHVVELQSDLAQKAGKVLSAEGRADLEAAYSKLVERNNAVQAERVELSRLGQRAGQEFRNLTGEAQSLIIRMREIEAKLAAGGKLEPISPMLRDWHKRLIREELADAARGRVNPEYEGTRDLIPRMRRAADEFQAAQGRLRPEEAAGYYEGVRKTEADFAKMPERLPPERVVRFADADTVAKVEGWPDAGEARRSQLAGAQERLASHQAHVETLEAMKRGEAPKDEYYAALKVADPEAYDRVLTHIDGELGYARESLREAQAQFDRTKTAWGDQTRFSKEHQGIYDRYSRDVTKFLKQLGGTHVVDSAGHGWWEVPVEGSKQLPAGKRAQQFGGASEDLLKSLAAVGGGAGIAWALSDKENKAFNAAWIAALAGLAIWARSRTTGLADMAQHAIHDSETLLGSIASEVRDMSPAALRRLTNHESEIRRHTYRMMEAIGPFVQKLSRVPDAKSASLDAAILTGKPGPVLEALGKSGQKGIIDDWRRVRGALEELGRGLVETGRLKQLLPDYFPRIVTDYDGLMKHLGVEVRSYMDDLIEKANDKSLKATGDALSPLDISLLVNKHLERAYTASGNGRAGFLKKRAFAEVTPELVQFYAPATESLPLYVQAAVKEIERARFFGKDLIRNAETGTVNIDASIGNIILGEAHRGKLSDVQLKRFEELLRGRFGPGERAGPQYVQTFRNIGNAMLLGNVFSALRNLSEVGTVATMQNMLPTLVSAVQIISKKPERITAADMGLMKHIAEEFIHGTRRPVRFKVPFKAETIRLNSAKFTDWTFKRSGWPLLDAGMKELSANAAVVKHQKLARTPKGQAEIRSTYGEYFGPNVEQLIADLRSGQKTPLTVELGIREVSDHQPLSKIELPLGYNLSPKLRIGYMLKSYPIKQLNLIRDRGVKEILRGNRLKGLSFLARYALLVGAAGMTTKNLVGMLLGQDPDWSVEAAASNVFQTFGLSSYAFDKLKQGRTAEAIGGLIVPPVGPMTDILAGRPEAIRNIPIVGPAAYSHLAGGAKKHNKRLKKTKEKREDD